MNDLERALNDAARRILVQTNYDSHFATLEDRVQVESKLFLARWNALQTYASPAAVATTTTSQHIGRGIYMSDKPATHGASLTMYRDSQGNNWIVGD